ncbi:D-amino-acid transaminase [Rhodospirillum rubrum]|uniref:Probable branched-chain-amino-acid aminotransferase n=1 Tax=Rhodospirillum rubrum (strain ATCC 11170 / ATH 1.1.1 / DSM 467 / LMG 4362 / NCIMB 8255 / S1) TaxID=269796 RepID=Q2RTR3_RHORT|nr:D-amino-acid transaminase [Rhodospirillum rubrum]ABC22482.1 branched chain amino acid: 2-keto-4-methylthiobutyrate aminotransferase [Rhodospirillum rubrum ATCC 11170]AEO48200.1 D-amino acid aminotransferase [Rhodospirillum rubrum F11]MBK1664746.1 D-amino-acid transaminase [Rhodospirillum rubrum]MBK1676406.1 D-amino-acid transaminase [Rhodospirillum rubrum]MBK5954066.1 D-amino-acid transaminase [Rhodospirillum rubrum]
MSRIAYVNGQYVLHRDAAVHIEDRGYQFSDGIYEVTAIYKGRPVDNDGHWDRLERSLRELRIDMPMTRGGLDLVAREVVRRNRVRNGIIYIQITRGVSPRNHPFPKDTPPSIVMTARHGLGSKPEVAAKGVSLISHPDIRWGRRDIKTVSLLPNVLAKQAAYEQHAYEAILVGPDGMVSECSSSNAWIVTKDGALVTRPLSNDILGGITRKRLIDLADAEGLRVEERSFSLDEAKAAREVFVSSTSSFAMPVVRIDDSVIGNGHPGSIVTNLRARYFDFLESASGPLWYGH